MGWTVKVEADVDVVWCGLVRSGGMGCGMRRGVLGVDGVDWGRV